MFDVTSRVRGLILVAAVFTVPAFAQQTAGQIDERLKDNYELMRMFAETFEQIDQNYVKDLDRRELVEAMFPYIENMLATTDLWLSRASRHMHGLFNGMKGTKAWKRYLAENSFGPEANVDTLKRALEVVPDETLDAICGEPKLG